MSEAEYGKYILYVSLYGIVASVASVPVSSGVIYNIFAENEEGHNTISLAGFLISIPTNAIICILLFAFSGVLDIPYQMIPLLFLHTVMDVMISAYLARSRYFYKAGSVLTIELLKSIVASVLAVIFVSRFSFGYLGRIFAFLITLLPFSLIALLSFLGSANRITGELVRKVTKNALPSLASTLFLSVGVYSVSILISAVLGEETLGSFSIFNTLATSPIFVISALISALAPYIQRRLASLDFSAVLYSHRLGVSLLSSLVMLIFLISAEAFAFLAPRRYGENAFILLPLLLYALMRFSDQYLTSVLSAVKIYRSSVVSNLVFSLTCIMMMLLLLRRIGLFAPGLALVTGTLASIAYKTYRLKSSLGLSVPPSDIALPFIETLLMGALALSLKEHPEIRILLAIFPAIRLLNLYFGNARSLVRGGH